MLGRFLELALLTGDPGAGWSDLLQLGFVEAASGDVYTHAYGVAACEGISIGLHAKGEEGLSLVFVRPDVAALERDLTARFIAVEAAQLGSDVFNELTLREPGGMPLRVIEARTFSPPLELPENTGLGRFMALSLPCADLAEARGFWERLDMDVQAGSAPWDSIALQGLPLACHDGAAFREPVLLFDGATAWDDHALRAAGMTIERPLPALRGHEHRVLRGVEGLAMIVLGANADRRAT
jgi:hypothetical protein